MPSTTKWLRFRYEIPLVDRPTIPLGSDTDHLVEALRLPL